MEFFVCIHFLTYLTFLTAHSVDAVALRGQKVRDATSADKLAFVVSLGMVNQPNSHFCTGTLISRQSVMTAGHCMLGVNKDDVDIMIGSTDLLKGQKYRVGDWKNYAQWYYDTEEEIFFEAHDIAMITLKERVENTNVKPASILYTSVDYLHCSKVRLAGWGIVDDSTRPIVLKTGVVKVISLADCLNRAEKSLGRAFYFPEHFFCSVANPWLLMGPGDSGAPVLNKQNQVIAIAKGECPLFDEDCPQDYVNNNAMNLHLHLLPYNRFIKALTID